MYPIFSEWLKMQMQKRKHYAMLCYLSLSLSLSLSLNVCVNPKVHVSKCVAWTGQAGASDERFGNTVSV